MRSTTHKSNLIQFSRASARLKANRRRRRCGVYRHLANIWSAQIRASSQIHIFLFWIDSRCLSRVSSLARSVQRATIMPQMCVFHFGWFWFLLLRSRPIPHISELCIREWCRKYPSSWLWPRYFRMKFALFFFARRLPLFHLTAEI